MRLSTDPVNRVKTDKRAVPFFQHLLSCSVGAPGSCMRWRLMESHCLAVVCRLGGLCMCGLVLCGSLAAAPSESPPSRTVPSSQPSGDKPLTESDAVHRELDEILSQPEFRRVRFQPQTAKKSPTIPKWLSDFAEWLGRHLDFIPRLLGGTGSFAQMVAYLVLAAVAALIVMVVVRALRAYQKRLDRTLRLSLPEEGELDAPPGDVSSNEYAAKAQKLAAEGRFREAVGYLVLGAMSFAERQGFIRFRRGLTHRDYLRALQSQQQLQRAFRGIVRIYEPLCFGRREPHRDHFDESWHTFMSHFLGTATAPRV